MAKQTAEQTKAITIAKLTNEQMATIAKGSQMLSASEFELVSGNYLKFEPNQLVTLVCTGLVEGADFRDKERMLPENAVEFITSSGATVINQDAVMVATVKRMVKEQNRKMPCILQVYHKGERINATGNKYADLAIGYKEISDEILAAIGL